MSLLLPFDLHERQRAIAPGASWAALADGLSDELEPLLQALAQGELPVPAQKARLTRTGGRCPVHGVLLDFDPWKPHHHHCARCARDYVGREHDDWWAMNAQLWTVERAVHAASLHALRGDERHAQLAEGILERLADGYTQWPNRDNVLGPSRPFFSTYLESIWLLNATHALALLESAGRHEIGGRIREQLLAPSSALIAGFPEGASNRQVWNEVAILSAWTLLGRTADIEQRWGRPGSLPWLFEHGLLDDGSWYEGENYHLFAHRGLWYGVQWMRARDHTLRPALEARFHRGFVTPLVGVLPDDTLPARRDSQYGTSVRQWRLAEHLELGLALQSDRTASAWLARLYAEPGETLAPSRRGRRLSTADAERHDAPGALSRDDLSWRALLMAHATDVADGTAAPASACLPSQGLAVIRRERGQVYVALEGGVTGGGHGHPDRLALTVQSGATRVLDDPGTGSYVERTLHWYRSTLAHHAPLVNGASQQRQAAVLLAFEDRGGAGWMRKSVNGLAPGVRAERTVIVCDGYLVDVLEWQADHAVTLSLPVAASADLMGAHSWHPAQRPGAGGLEDGFDFLSNVAEAWRADGAQSHPAGASMELQTSRMRGWYAATVPVRWLRAEAPAPPLPPGESDAASRASSTLARHWIEAEGANGRIVGVWAWSGNAAGDRAHDAGMLAPNAVLAVDFPPYAPALASSAKPADDSDIVVRVHTADGTVSAHRPVATGWQIGLVAGAARSSIDLDLLPAPVTAEATPQRAIDQISSRPALEIPHVHGASDSPPALQDMLPDALSLPLGASHYRQTEEQWGDGHSPSASLELLSTDRYFIARVRFVDGAEHAIRLGTGAPDIMPDNPLDNERADVNVAGVQWYLTLDGAVWQDAGLVVPLANAAGRCRIAPLVPPSGGTVLGQPPLASWAPCEGGWRMQLAWPVTTTRPVPQRIGMQWIVNQAVEGRERRLGQLALAGGGGFAYLRGDRESPTEAVPLLLNTSLSA